MATQVGLDITTDANDPRAVCLDCMDGAAGEPLHDTDEWGGVECRCATCGELIDVIVVEPR